METFSFSLILADDTHLDDDVAERVCREVGSDTLFGTTSNGTTYIDFEREGASRPETVASAIKDVEKIGLQVTHVKYF